MCRLCREFSAALLPIAELSHDMSAPACAIFVADALRISDLAGHQADTCFFS
jgi:hypothetical protein